MRWNGHYYSAPFDERRTASDCKNVKASVINAGDGMNEHPTQALLDAFTIMQYKGGFEGLKGLQL